MAFAAPSVSLTSSIEDITVSTETGALQTISPEALSMIGGAGVLTPEVIMKISSMGSLLAFLPLFFVLFLAIVSWKIYFKAGYPGWHSLVPILNVINFVRFTGTGLLIVVTLILSFLPILLPAEIVFVVPFALGILSFMMVYKTAKSFGKGIGFTFGLFFLGLIFFPILAFNKNITYVGPGGKKA